MKGEGREGRGGRGDGGGSLSRPAQIPYKRADTEAGHLCWARHGARGLAACPDIFAAPRRSGHGAQAAHVRVVFVELVVHERLDPGVVHVAIPHEETLGLRIRTAIWGCMSIRISK